MKKKQTTVAAAEVTDPLSVGRHMGEHIWGYEVLPDGTIQLAPGFSDRFEAILATEKGLHKMLNQVSSYVAAELAQTTAARRKWWDELQQDLGIALDSREGWIYIGYGLVKPPKKEAVQDA